MNTFEQSLSPVEWTEILDGGEDVAFDLLDAVNVEVLFTESATQPDAATKGNAVKYWPDTWDFSALGMVAGGQRIWVKGSNTIRGVRGVR